MLFRSMEPKKIYRTLKASVPVSYYTLPLDKARIVKKGRDITLVAYGAMVEVIQQAAQLAEAEGYDCEVIDLMSLLPFDLETLCASVEKTSRMVVVHEAPQTCGHGAELIAAVQEQVFTKLAAPLQRVTGFDTPFPYTLENHYMPTPERVLAAIEKAMNF